MGRHNAILVPQKISDNALYLAKNEKAYLSVIEQFIKRVPSVVALEKMLADYDQIEIPTEHIFAGGVYIRQITIPKDAFLIGKRHRYKTCDIMLSGRMVLYNGHGKEPITVEAPIITESPKYKKKMGYAYSETVWLNAFPTDKTDIDEIEKDIFITEDAFEDYEDFKNVIKLYGFTEEIVRSQTENKDDIIDFDKNYGLRIDNSDREGKGLFTDRAILRGEYIAPSRIKDKRTPAGRYTNHSINPNALMVLDKDRINLIASRDILENEEITVNYRNSMEILGVKPCQV